MDNIDHVSRAYADLEKQDKRIKQLEAEILEVEKKYMDAWFSKDIYKELEAELVQTKVSSVKDGARVNQLETENQRLRDAIKEMLENETYLGRKRIGQKALKGKK